MKKFILLLLSFAILCCSSCTGKVEPAETDSTSETQAVTSETQQAATEADPRTWVTGYHESSTVMMQSFVETPSAVLLVGMDTVKDGVAQYYSKIDGELYPFCFDPLCNHENKDENGNFKLKCVGGLLADSNFYISNMSGDQSSIYSESSRIFYIGSRFYIFFGNMLFSCNELAGDIRIEFSFGNGDPIQEYYDRFTEYNIGCEIGRTVNDGESLFFTRVSTEGQVEQYRYDTVQKKLYNLSELLKAATDESKESYVFSGFIFGKIYLTKSVLGADGSWTEDGSYETDYNFSEFSNTFALPRSVRFQLIDGEVSNVRSKSENTNTLYRLNSDGTQENLTTFGYREIASYSYLTDTSFLYCCYSPVDIGVEHNPTGGDKTVSNGTSGKLCRVDFETGEKTVIFDNLQYDSFYVYFYDRTNKVIVFSSAYYDLQEAGSYVSGNTFVVGTLDENGVVTEIRTVQ